MFVFTTEEDLQFKASTLYDLSFYVSHHGTKADPTTFTMKFVWGNQNSANTMDTCSPVYQVKFGTQEKILSLNNVSFSYGLPNKNSRSMTSITFSLSERAFLRNTGIAIDLGFMLDENLVALEQGMFECTVYDFLTQSQNDDFVSLSYDTKSKNLFLRPHISMSESNITNTIYQVNCTGFKFTDGQSSAPLRIKWVDFQTANGVIQYGQINPFPQRVLQPDVTSNNIKFIKKYFNSPSSDTIFEFQIIPTQSLTGRSRIYLEIPVNYPGGLSRNGRVVTCLINDQPVVCETKIRGITIYPIKYFLQNLPARKPFSLKIIGIQNSITYSQFAKIWLAVDFDQIIENIDSNHLRLNLNGIDMMQEFYDKQFDSFETQELKTSTIYLSSNKTQNANLSVSINITVPLQTITSDNNIWIYIPHQIKINTDFQCNITRLQDSAQQNFVKGWTIQSNYILVNLTTDINNIKFESDYQILLYPLTSPDSDSTDFEFDFMISDASLNSVFLRKKASVTFEEQKDIIQLIWYVYYFKNNTYVPLTTYLQSDKYFKVTHGYFEGDQALFLGSTQPQNRFNSTIIINLDQQLWQDFIIYGTSNILTNFYEFTNQPQQLPVYQLRSLQDLQTTHIQQQGYQIQINSGETGYWLKLTGKSHVSTQQFTVETDYIAPTYRRQSWGLNESSSNYSKIPRLNLQIFNKKCKLRAQFQSYDLPLNGFTLPINLNFDECFPSEDLQVIAYFQDPTPAKVVVLQDTISMNLLNIHNQITFSDEQLLSTSFKLKATSKAVVGKSFNLSFNLSGANQGDYYPVENVTINIVKALKAKSLSAKQINGTYKNNLLQIQLQCSLPSQIYYIIAENELQPKDYETIKSTNIKNGVDFSAMKNADGSKTTLFFNQDPSIEEWNNPYIINQVNELDVIDLSPWNLIQNFYFNSLASKVSSNQSLDIDNIDLTNPQNDEIVQAISDIDASKFQLNTPPIKQALRRRYYVKSMFTSSRYLLNFTNLQPNTNYSFGYYCQAQDQSYSNFVQHWFRYNSNQTSGQILKLGFSQALSSDQINNIVCSTAETLSLNTYQVMNDEGVQCETERLSYSKSQWSDFEDLILSQLFPSSQTAAEKQEAFNAFTYVYIYVNNYKSSNGQILNANDIDYKQQIKNIINQTDDPQIAVYYTNMTLQQQEFTDRSREELTTQFFLGVLNLTEQNQLSLQFQSRRDIISFVGLQYIDPITKHLQNYNHPSGIQLRQGLWGSGDPINFGVKRFRMKPYQNHTVVFSNLTINSSYILYWSSVPPNVHPLSQQYQDTGMYIFNFNYVKATYSLLITILIMSLLFI